MEQNVEVTIHKDSTLTRRESRFLVTDNEEEQISFFHDFIAGGVAGSASVIVGHPFDTMKVRLQAMRGGGPRPGLMSLATSYGGVGSLFRGMAAPLYTACVVNALIFSSYGWSSRLYDEYLVTPKKEPTLHDTTFKAYLCGSFAGLIQAAVICPMEHVKCRLQVQHGTGSADNLYKGPLQATRAIVSGYGVSGLFRGWWATFFREVPAFGIYFAFYDFAKERINSFFAKQAGVKENEDSDLMHSHTLAASALAGGLTGAITWGIVYPFDVIKTRIQTSPLETPASKRRILYLGRSIIREEGVAALFRGVNITLIRAFPVNGIIFPVYEFTLLQIASLEY